MSLFETYLSLGFKHIADINAYDHMLFLVALCAVYQLRQFKTVLILVTSFTIGHSLSLALSTLNYMLVPTKIIEFLIPVTIFLTCIYNILNNKHTHDHTAKQKPGWNYLITLFFGLIHGMGFSNYLKMLLGKEESIVIPLLAFNIGLELGQILIVALILIATFVLLNVIKIKYREWVLIISSAAGTLAFTLIAENKFW